MFGICRGQMPGALHLCLFTVTVGPGVHENESCLLAAISNVVYFRRTVFCVLHNGPYSYMLFHSE